MVKAFLKPCKFELCWCEFLPLECCILFTPNMQLPLVSNYFPFRLKCPKNIIPENLDFVLCFFPQQNSVWTLWFSCTENVFMNVTLEQSLSDCTGIHLYIKSCKHLLSLLLASCSLLSGWTTVLGMSAVVLIVLPLEGNQTVIVIDFKCL